MRTYRTQSEYKYWVKTVLIRKSKQSEKVKTPEVTVLYQALGLTSNLDGDKAKYYTFYIYSELTRATLIINNKDVSIVYIYNFCSGAWANYPTRKQKEPHTLSCQILWLKLVFSQLKSNLRNLHVQISASVVEVVKAM